MNWTSTCLYELCGSEFMPHGGQRYCSRRCSMLATPIKPHKHRKLTQDQVDEIRRRYIPQPKMAQLAKEFKVSSTVISNIINRKSRREYHEEIPRVVRRYKKDDGTIPIDELKRRANARFFGDTK